MDNTKGESGDARQPDAPPTDEQIKLAIEGLGANCLKAVDQEIQQLTSALAVIEDALKYRAIKSYMSVWSVINTLTDGIEVDKLAATVPPASMFHKNPGMVSALVNYLRQWQTEGFFSNQHSLIQAYNILRVRQADDQRFLDNCK